MKTTKDFTFFWGNIDPFSNWHRPASFQFKEIGFAQSEQFFMFCKAMHFGDRQMAYKILFTKDPRKNKDQGKLVSGFDKKEWEDVSYHYMYVACREKFLQNQKLLDALMYTGDTEIVEASPYDLVWGIGWHQNDAEALDRKLWRGKNLLGEILTVLREEIKMVGVEGMDRTIDTWWTDTPGILVAELLKEMS